MSEATNTGNAESWEYKLEKNVLRICTDTGSSRDLRIKDTGCAEEWELKLEKAVLMTWMDQSWIDTPSPESWESITLAESWESRVEN